MGNQAETVFKLDYIYDGEQRTIGYHAETITKAIEKLYAQFDPEADVEITSATLLPYQVG